MVFVMLSNDLVIVAPVDQRNVAFTYKLKVSEPMAVVSNLRLTEKACSDACLCAHK